MMVKRIFDLLDNYKEKFSKKTDALASKQGGIWNKVSATEFLENVTNVSYGLLNLGVQKGDKVALISNNRPEWNFLDLGMMQAGVINVPIYPTISDTDLKFIFNDAEIKYVFVSNKDLYNKALNASEGLPSLKGIYTIDKVEGAKNWSEISEAGKKNPAKEKIETIKNSISENDLATILYTSGTTGNPKGVMLSHKNIVSNFYAVRNLPPVDSTCKALSFLPLNHVYERMLTYFYFYIGVSIYYAESLETIADNLKEIKPEIFTTVPRLLEKVYDKIVAKGNDLTGIKKKLFFWALDLGLRYDTNGSWWYNMQLKLANKLIFSKWRDALGGNVRAVVSGGAALQPRLARVFWAAGIPVLEGYGLTETSPVIAVNTFDKGGLKFGTVGLPLENVEIKIAADGEILCKGPNVMLGYYKRPDLTAEVIDSDGYFHTGDIGVLEDGKYLKITDRKKEIFKTSGGKYIAPQMIENKLKESPLIEQVLVLGENQKYASALIVPAFAALKDWCAKNNIEFKSNEEIIKNTAVIKKIQEEVNKVNTNLAPYESIKKFELMPLEWSIDKGEMTPKMSLKRKIILEANKDNFEKMYKV